MRAKREWERVRSPHARFLEGLQTAVANHPSTSGRVRANTDERSKTARARLTVVGATADNVIPLPINRGQPTDRARRKPGAKGRGGTPAA